MQLTTQDNFADYDVVQTIGLVKGNAVQARHAGRDMMAGFKKFRGGEIESIP